MIRTEAELENLLASPSDADVAFARKLDGDVVVLGAAGKMGPSLVARAQRALRAAGSKFRVIAVTRSGAPVAEGVETVAADLLDRSQVNGLPYAPNVIYMVGRKFGSTGNEPLTWAVNALVPAFVAERYRGSRIVAFSTGNVYPFVPVASGGATEATRPEPIGDYAQSALARERIFEYFSAKDGTPVLLLRLNYAIELRYGVLVDIAQKVLGRVPIDLAMGHVNVIWQGDANSVCLRSLELARSPARALNLTGADVLSVRDLALGFGRLFSADPVFEGQENPNALLSNAAECHRNFGAPAVSVPEMMEMIASWLEAGGRTLGKPTHFETRTGSF
ncbi:MAG TPA: NAD-dependent epimerase/dehydratase family protein [Bryobacteraceae bacterium]|nr:NAD-dependent epimerase/dehydratase family protein [Bryobacteraceae bacterium]